MGFLKVVFGCLCISFFNAFIKKFLLSFLVSPPVSLDYSLLFTIFLGLTKKCGGGIIGFTKSLVSFFFGILGFSWFYYYFWPFLVFLGCSIFKFIVFSSPFSFSSTFSSFFPFSEGGGSLRRQDLASHLSSLSLSRSTLPSVTPPPPPPPNTHSLGSLHRSVCPYLNLSFQNVGKLFHPET